MGHYYLFRWLLKSALLPSNVIDAASTKMIPHSRFTVNQHYGCFVQHVTPFSFRESVYAIY